MPNSFRVNNKAESGKPTRFYSSRQEKAVAKAVGGRQTANSGATALQKSDVLNDLFSLECKTKTTNSDSISIKREWFEKQLKESLQMGKKYSAIVFNFGPDAPYNENRYIIDESLFRELLDYLRSEE
jgi:hypothetical protein